MQIVYVEIPNWYTDEARKYVKQLIGIICSGNTQLAEGSDNTFVVGLCTEENYELLQYLSHIDAIALTTEDSVSEICPEAIVIGTAMCPVSPA